MPSPEDISVRITFHPTTDESDDGGSTPVVVR
jgi:hypothetical protein